jgi:spore germination protein KC
MRARCFKIICIVLAVMLTGGCWDSINLEDREICTAVIVDKEEGGYAFWVEVAAITSFVQNPSSEMGNLKQPMTNAVSAQGKTLADAREALDRELNKPVFIGAVQALIMTQRMAENGIEEYLYRVRQMTDYRKTMDIIVTPDDPAEFLNTKPENASAVGFAIEYTLESQYEQGRTIHISLAEVLEKLACKNTCYIANFMSGKSGQLTLIGYAVFRGSKMIGSIPIEKSRGIVYLSCDSVPEFRYVVPTGDTVVTVRAIRKGISTEVEYKDGKIHFYIDLHINATGLYSQRGDYITYQMQDEMKRSLGDMIAKDVYDAIITSRDEFSSDYMSFSETFRIKYPDIYDSMDWDKEFKNAEFSINVDIQLGPDKTLDYNPEKR